MKFAKTMSSAKHQIEALEASKSKLSEVRDPEQADPNLQQAPSLSSAFTHSRGCKYMHPSMIMVRCACEALDGLLTAPRHHVLP